MDQPLQQNLTNYDILVLDASCFSHGSLDES